MLRPEDSEYSLVIRLTLLEEIAAEEASLEISCYPGETVGRIHCFARPAIIIIVKDS